MAWGYVDDEAVEEARSLIGQPLRRERNRWVSEATPDAIDHFVEGIGDANPLWTDDEYAAGTRWGTRLAPPCFLYAVDLTVVAPKFPGVQWLHAGTDWTFYDVIRVRDAFDVRAVLQDVEIKTGRFANRWALQSGRVDYTRRADGFRVATAIGYTARTPRGEALAKDGKNKYEAREPHRYTAEEIQVIEKQILNEEVRGAQPRYWEDVAVGDPLGPVVKGPLTTTDIIAFYSGTLGARHYGGAHGNVVRYRQRHADYHVSEITGAKDSAGRGHVEQKTGMDVGMGGAYDLCPQRLSWGGHLLTNWMGDDGFLHRYDARVRRPNLVADTTWWTGEVTGKTTVQGRCAVEVAVKAVNQRDEQTADGTAVILLPSREHGPVRVPLDPEE
jgi:acyl dehydratase